VVLPFVNRSADADNEYFSDGLTDEVITDLARVSALRVISRNSAMALKGTTKNTAALARELGVTHLVTGTVRRAGQSLRITAELVDARTDTPVWSEKFSGSMEDVFGIQEDISRPTALITFVQATATCWSKWVGSRSPPASAAGRRRGTGSSPSNR
jgi:adenylate cyclase